MNKKLIIIIITTALVLFGAYKSSINVVSNSNTTEKLLPDLEKNIDNIGNVIIQVKGKSFQIHLENGQWVIADRFLYPVGIEKIRDLVQNSASINILEKKTATPESLQELGLDTPEKEDSNAIRVTLQSVDGKNTYADYIRGINRKGVSGAGRGEIYARLFNDNQAYLVRSELGFDLTAHALLSGETFAIPYNKFQSIEFNYPQQNADNFTLGKDLPTDLDFKIIEPKNNDIKAYGKVNAIGTSLEYMELEDILPVENFPITEPEVIITYKTFNGLTMIVKLFKNNNENWLTFNASDQ